MDFISVPLVAGMVFLAIYKVFKLFVCRRERIMLIEKMENLSNKDLNLSGLSLDRDSINFGGKFVALRIGGLLIGLGLGIFVGVLVAYALFPEVQHLQQSLSWGVPSMVMGGSVLFFGGLGLVTSFLVELRYKKDKE